MQTDNTDSASLHFESILEGDISQNHGSGGDSTADANGNRDMAAVAGPSTGTATAAGIDHFLFDIQRDNYDIPRNNVNPSASTMERSYQNTDLNIDIDIERKKREFSYKYTNYGQPKNELTGNALFNKFRDAADGCAIVAPSSADAANHNHVDDDDDDDTIDTNDDEQLSEGKLKGSNSNSVSCEDLLEFANKKPKGKERGIESDEVRIMTKVLGTNVSKPCTGIDHFQFRIKSIIFFPFFFNDRS